MDIDLFERVGRFGHEGVYVAADPTVGLRAIIGVHSTVLGPALGGTRFRPYPTFDDALEDVLRLSRAMTYKAAAAGLPLGGGKAVILGDPRTLKTDALLEAYGRAIDALGGRYVTAEDMGTTVDDMCVVRRSTPHVMGLPISAGGSGDPSPVTARGVLAAMRSTAGYLWGSEDLAGRRIVVQGVGKVGGALAEMLAAEGCDLELCDVDGEVSAALADRIGGRVVGPDQATQRPCDVFAPCAVGGVLNAETIPHLQCSAVVGSANNQLASDDDADRLAAAGIAYAPDFVVNAGGIDNIAEEFHPDGYSLDRALERVERIGTVTREVFETADMRHISTLAAARALAEERLAAAV